MGQRRGRLGRVQARTDSSTQSMQLIFNLPAKCGLGTIFYVKYKSQLSLSQVTLLCLKVENPIPNLPLVIHLAVMDHFRV